VKNEERNGAVVLLSGGMDSAALLHFVARRLGPGRVHALSFFYGQKHAREMEMARWQAGRAGVAVHREVDLSFFGRLVGEASALTGAARNVPDQADLRPADLQQPPTYVPNRNLVFLSLAAAYAESAGLPEVYYGAQTQDCYGYWDCTPEFVERLNGVLRLNRGSRVAIRAPFAGKSKAEVLKIGLAMQVDYTHTWTCYRGGEKPCGLCPSCAERIRAFKKAGIADPGRGDSA